MTVGRSDYGLYVPILRRIQQEPTLRLQLFVSGMHLSPEFGRTIETIEADGFEIDERIEMLLSSDTPAAIAKSMGIGTQGFAQAYARRRPDVLLVLGDRFEMHSAVVAALPFKMPIAHIHGGESTEGLIDEAIRHSITKMSHLHFVSAEPYARRVVQMGEEPWRVTVTGAPGLDNLRHVPLLTRAEVERQLGIPVARALLVTYHPVTLEFEQLERQVKELLIALEGADREVIFTYPNADTRGRTIVGLIRDFVDHNGRARLFVNLGTQMYFSLMTHVAAMVGNTSSGIVEAASFKLPVVNVGNRQRGRLQTRNIVNVGYDHDDILAGIRKVLAPEFRAGLADLVNPYGDGHAAERIVTRLAETALDDRLLLKRFHDVAGPA